MAQQSMRGMRLGSQSYESEVGVVFSARSKHSYVCSKRHLTEMVFSADAEVPNTWTCKQCSAVATLQANGQDVIFDAAEEKIPRSHWEMLLERRSREELEEILEERLVEIRARRLRLETGI
jgi:thioesterase domain-containing protein